MKKESEKERLRRWQETVQADTDAYSAELLCMGEREGIFEGRHTLKPLYEGDELTETPYVRNIAKELIESQINSELPNPKVTPRRAEDESLATLIEDMIRNKLDQLPFEAINDQMERTVPTQGGGFYCYDWDSSRATHTEQGAGVAHFRHPRQVIPQEGVTGDIADMDRITIKIPQTKEYIKRMYGKELGQEGEAEPGLRSADGSAGTASGMVTQVIIYYRNESGGIGKYSYVNDTELENLEDYQARYLKRCRKCGAYEPIGELDPLPATTDGSYPADEGSFEDTVNEAQIIRSAAAERAGHCPYCGGTYEETKETELKVSYPIELPNGEMLNIGDVVPYYKPDLFPIFLQRNVSRYGKFLGDSDIDLIADQQNAINRLYAKTFERHLKGGSYLTLPPGVEIEPNGRDSNVLHLNGLEERNYIGVYDLSPDVSQTIALEEQIYSDAQKLIGVTDSFLGRKDTTATSGKAKEFSAAQAAGRMESKRIMKQEMFSRLFEAIFKFELAFAGEERPVSGTDEKGNRREETWNKWLFLRKDAAGEYYWDTDFSFSCDSTAPLASNRAAMWQETRSHFEGGAFGDPTQTETQIIYWGMMAELHYPLAEKIKKQLSDQQTRQAKQQLEAALAQKEAMQQAKEAVPDNAFAAPNNEISGFDNVAPDFGNARAGFDTGGETL